MKKLTYMEEASSLRCTTLRHELDTVRCRKHQTVPLTCSRAGVGKLGRKGRRLMQIGRLTTCFPPLSLQ